MLRERLLAAWERLKCALTWHVYKPMFLCSRPWKHGHRRWTLTCARCGRETRPMSWRRVQRFVAENVVEW